MSPHESEPRWNELDERIHDALRVETLPQQLDQMEQFWRRQGRARRRRHVLLSVTAAAAAVLILCVWLQPWKGTAPLKPAQDALATVDRVAPQPRPSDTSPPTSPTLATTNEGVVSHGRPATTQERFLFTALMQKRNSQTRRTTASDVANAIAVLTRHPDSDPAQLIGQHHLDAANAERLLLRQLSRGDDEHKQAVLKLLSVRGTSASIVPLVQLSDRKEFRDAALDTLQQAVGYQGLAQAACCTANAQVRAEIFRRLLGHEDGVDAYLSLVQNAALRAIALDSAKGLSPGLLNSLLTRLTCEDRDVRFAAALVLGHVNGPLVTQSLIDVVSNNPGSSEEAWIALMNCRGPQAQYFLASATVQPRLLGPLNRARAYWARMIH